MKHTLAVLVENKPGALTRITSMFARRGYHLQSPAVGPTERRDVSRLTLTAPRPHHPPAPHAKPKPKPGQPLPRRRPADPTGR